MFFLSAIVFAYFKLTTSHHRAGGVICALGFILIETMWTSIATEDPLSGAVSVKFPPPRLGHSSFAQFWVNVLFTPGLLFFYRFLVSSSGLPYARAIRVFCFPFDIWCLEVVEGYLLMFLFGRNVAWEYRGPSAYFHGNITLQYYAPWCLLGGAVELLYNPLIVPAVTLFDLFNVGAKVLPAAAVLTALFAPRMSLVAGLGALTGKKFD